MNLAETIRNVPDFPKKGIGFKDITTLLGNGEALCESIRQMKKLFENEHIDAVVGIESRGFIFASILAHEWRIAMVPVRKPGKLPAETISESYDLEYGTDTIEIHKDAVQKGQKVLIVDDLLATGGTVVATTKLLQRLGAEIVGCCFVIELEFLNPREKLSQFRVESLVKYQSE